MKIPTWTTLSPEAARAAGTFLVSLSALSVVTCASATRPPLGAPAAAASVGPAPQAAAVAPAVAASTEAPEPPAVEVAPPPPTAVPAEPALARFKAALREAAHQAEPTRILWLGDSHAAADFWPEAVRKPLQEAFGVGGPGFLYAGLGVYRHAGVKVQREGKWRVEPRQPSLCARQDDGVFGLGGIRAVPEDVTSTARFELAVDAVRGKARWDVAFRLPTARARFTVMVSGGESKSIDATTAAVGTTAHVTIQTERGATLTLGHAAFDPELFGVTVEGTEPGVVIDTLGINGARIATPLAWEADPWVNEVKLRNPALFVFAYGTNEVGDQVAPFRYGPELEALVQRARQGAPSADCLVVGPTDCEGPGWTPLPRVLEIEDVERQTAERLGCAYFSAVGAMGGEGSLKRWALLEPPLAAVDRVHLTPRGYGELGTMMARVLLEGGE